MKKEIIISILNTEYKVVVCFGEPDQIKKTMKAWGHDEIKDVFMTDGGEGRRGVCFYTKNCHPIIAMPEYPKTPEQIGTLAHEAVHAIDYIFTAMGQNDYGEVFAHSVGAVVREVLNTVKKH